MNNDFLTSKNSNSSPSYLSINFNEIRENKHILNNILKQYTGISSIANKNIQQPHNNILNRKLQNNIKLFNSIHTINIVYQYSYKNEEKVTGFGDFIRGCYFLLQFSDRTNKNVGISIYNHEMSYYLENFYLKEQITKDIAIETPFFKKDNYKYVTNNNIITYEYTDIDTDLKNYICNLKNYNGNVYLFLINHPCETKITEIHQEIVKEIIKPTYELSNIVNNALNKLNLIQKKYKVIHLRMDDSNFYNDSVKNTQILFLIYRINMLLQKIVDDFFLISNSNYIKSIIIKKIPRIKTIFSEITHIADKNLNNKNNLLNTLKEFYIMSYSNQIYSFSVYEHGSGFSKWCSVTYDIPYVCYKIPC
jgi:hypothetical protein